MFSKIKFPSIAHDPDLAGLTLLVHGLLARKLIFVLPVVTVASVWTSGCENTEDKIRGLIENTKDHFSYVKKDLLEKVILQPILLQNFDYVTFQSALT